MAREWHADAMGLSPGAGWKATPPLPSPPPPPPPPAAAAAAPGAPTPSPPPPPPSSASASAKPSRLSAAPKSRLHDGEAWMAKRKVAVEDASVVSAIFFRFQLGVSPSLGNFDQSVAVWQTWCIKEFPSWIPSSFLLVTSFYEFLLVITEMNRVLLIILSFTGFSLVFLG